MESIEIIKLIVTASTPIVVLILGMLLLRRIESIKKTIALRSDFHKQWADQFFECCQSFIVTLERKLALLTVVTGLNNPDSDYGENLQKEISDLLPTLAELELRIRRSVVFAPKNGSDVKQSATTCMKLVANLINSRQGNVDEIIENIDQFNRRVRLAHAEIIEDTNQ